MTVHPKEPEGIHSALPFFLGFLAAALWPGLWIGTIWILYEFHPTGWKWERPLFWGLLTVGFHQWLFILPCAWFMKGRGWQGSSRGLLSGAGLLLLANLLLVAVAIYFLFAFVPEID
jgi:hypothetical protein